MSIEYDVIRHPNGKIRLIENVNGQKRFVTKGKKRYFDDVDAEELILDQNKHNERKARLSLNNKRTRVHV